MGSVVDRKGRRRWYAKIRDARSGDWRLVTTPFFKSDPAGKRKALEWANKHDRVGDETKRLAPREGWAAWTTAWLHQQFGYNRNTLVRYTTAWAHLFEFVVERRIRAPRELRYAHASEYLAWRTKQVRRRGTAINHNTALTEMKVMSRIMEEARRREYCDANPWMRLGIRRQNVRHAPPMDLHEIERHRVALAEEEGAKPIAERWMTVSFETALNQSVRLTATELPMSRVHLDPETQPGRNLDRMTFDEKGRNGAKMIRTLPVNPRLRPLLLELKAAGAEWTCRHPRSKRGVSLAAVEFWKFRKRHGLGHLRFHSTRATVGTELARRNVSKSLAMDLMGHKTEAVNQGYVHVTSADLAHVLEGLDFSTPDRRGSPGSASASG